MTDTIDAVIARTAEFAHAVGWQPTKAVTINGRTISSAELNALLAELTRLRGDQDREQIARLIDPSRWAVFDGYLADVKRKYAGQDAAYDPESFKDKKSLAIADAIIALRAAPPPSDPELGGKR